MQCLTGRCVDEKCSHHGVPFAARDYRFWLWAKSGNRVKGDRGKGMAILGTMDAGWEIYLPISALG